MAGSLSILFRASTIAALAAFTLLFTGTKATAGQLSKSMLVGSPQIHLSHGRPYSCGLRVTGVELGDEAGNAPLHVVDGSVMITLTGHGTVKGIHSLVTRKQIQTNQPGNAGNTPLKSFWFKAPSHAATLPIKDIPTDTKNALFFVTDADSALGVISAVAEEKAIQVGFLESQATTEIVLYGSVTISVSDYEQIHQCIVELRDQIGADKR